MPKDKYASIFSRQMEAIVIIILQIFFRNRRCFDNWGLFLSFSRGNIRSSDAFRPIACERKYLMDYNYQHFTTSRAFCPNT